MTYTNWTDEEVKEIQVCDSYTGMKDIALSALKRMAQPVVQVCGPITTGGKGSIEENLNEFRKAIEFLEKQGKSVFDQRPFEAPMQKLKTTRKEGGYAHEILDEFYLPLFESGLIRELYFLPGWESSTGARWEHDKAKNFGMAISYISDNEL